jgi:predicted TIM-barrel fold metal-dependent hydrolase
MTIDVSDPSTDPTDTSEIIWVNSADSHLMEPHDLWFDALPKELAEQAPRTERSDRFEIVMVEGRQMHRLLAAFAEQFRPPGATDLTIRLQDLDREGVWGQLAFPSRALWLCTIQDPALEIATIRAYNDWAVSEVMAHTDRVLPAGMIPVHDVDAGVAEVERLAHLGFQAVFLAASPMPGEEYALPRWDPIWSAIEATGMVAAFHIGTGGDPVVYRGPGGAIVNYWETCIPGQRVVTHLVASGALARHPNLDVLIAEGGCSWIPALGDRLDEAYRQHEMYVDPKLDEPPSSTIFRQVYSSFQHDRSAVPAVAAMGYRNAMWGDDYPHLEGTYGHTQQTLHDIFDGATDEVRRLVTEDNFNKLFEVPDRL